MNPSAILLLLASLPVAALAQLVPLGPAVAELDYKAYMSSIEHIRASMGGNWPKPGLRMDDQAKDMAGEKAQWDARKSFPYAVLSADGSKEFGCFYIRPCGKGGLRCCGDFGLVARVNFQMSWTGVRSTGKPCTFQGPANLGTPPHNS